MRSLDRLTKREGEVLWCVAAGQTNQQIAAQLIIHVSTVQNHLHNIYDKLGVSSRTMAVIVALQRGLFQQYIDDFIQARSTLRVYADSMPISMPSVIPGMTATDTEH